MSLFPSPWSVVSLLRKPGEPKARCVVCRPVVLADGSPECEYLRDADGKLLTFATWDEAHAAIACIDCPPAGASSEVNEAAASVAAPAVSGQSAGIPSGKKDWDIFHGTKWLATRRAVSARAAIAQLRREAKRGAIVNLPAELSAGPATFLLF
ncbi:MAG: hypothetical protein QM586_14160 [Xenophilus sp.]